MLVPWFRSLHSLNSPCDEGNVRNAAAINRLLAGGAEGWATLA
jgi:hypothetical protein